MPKSPSELRDQLSTIESDDATYEGLGRDDVASLTSLLEDDEGWLAARAVHALSRIDDPLAHEAILAAASMPRLEVRVAAATEAGRLPAELSDGVLLGLLGDPEPAVRKFAVRSVSPRNGVAVRSRVQELADAEPNPRIKDMAEEKSRST
jgi:HEAT repeat protein